MQMRIWNEKLLKFHRPFGRASDYAEFRDAFQVLAQSMMAQSNSEVVVPVLLNIGMVVTRVTNFNKMNALKFHGSEIEEDPQEFIDEMYKVLMIVGVGTIRAYTPEATRHT
uniref:Gag-pol polyprotein n=1 Tax=Solanum tuberosum TaxID=4113 RepID=M1DTR1_SOLTU